MTLHFSRGWDNQLGTGLPPLRGLQHWHHHHSPAGGPGQPRRHAALRSPGTARHRFPVPSTAALLGLLRLQPQPCSPRSRGTLWAPHSPTSVLVLPFQDDFPGITCGHPLLFVPLSLYLYLSPASLEGSLLLCCLRPGLLTVFSGVFKSGPLVHVSNVTLPKFLFLHVPRSLAKECGVFPEPILGMPAHLGTFANHVMPPKPRHVSASKLSPPTPNLAAPCLTLRPI